MDTLSIVCPVYNEESNIQRLFAELQSKISVPIEVLVVYDFDEDATLPVLRQIAPLYRFTTRLVKNRLGPGVLNAIKTGFMEARSEAVLVVMADLSDNLSAVDQMYQLIVKDGFDIVCGSRYMPGGRQIGGPFLKKSLSRCAGISLRCLTGLPTHDVTNSFKMYRRSFLNSVDMESSGGFEIGMELVVKAFVQGGKITEVPTTWSDRTTGKSRFRLWKWLPKYLKWYLYAFKKYVSWTTTKSRATT